MGDGRLRLGLIGAGWIAQTHMLPAVRASDFAEVEAVVDPDPQALAAVAAQAPGAKLFERPGDFLEQANVDAVYVATPNCWHEPYTLAAAARGWHVLCEKPLAPTGAAVDRMLGACRSAGVSLATAYNQRHHPAHRRIYEAVAKGALGDVITVRIDYVYWLDPAGNRNWRASLEEGAGGSLVDMAPHGLDLTQHLLQREVLDLDVCAQRRVFGYPIDDGALVFGHLHGDVLIALHTGYNYLAGYPRRVLEVVGTRAMVRAVDTMGQTPGGWVQIIHGNGGHQQSLDFDRTLSPYVVMLSWFARLLANPEANDGAIHGEAHTLHLLEAACRRRGLPWPHESMLNLHL